VLLCLIVVIVVVASTIASDLIKSGSRAQAYAYTHTYIHTYIQADDSTKIPRRIQGLGRSELRIRARSQIDCVYE
jgi:hypothetical protein